MSAEEIKRESRHLRGELLSELASGDASFSGDGQTLLKFHGIYQQDDRDVRRERTSQKLPLDYSCMVRASVPGGRLTPAQWLALDTLAEHTDGTLRLTTRQGVQLHFVHKPDLQGIVNAINAAGLTTLAACGDVVRNVMGCPAPEHDHVIQPVLDALVARFRPRTTAYWELWIDGAKAASSEPVDADSAAPATIARPSSTPETEPVYGDVYLPRKFKIGVAWPGDNCIDVYSNDVGIVPTLSEGTSGELTGFVVLAGGGLGRSAARDDTYPRLGSPLVWVTPDDLVDVVEAIVTTQRDFGNREDRKKARLKYLVDERGVDWLRAQVEARVGKKLDDPVELPSWDTDHHHGADAATMGLPVPNGRVRDHESVFLRSALRELIAGGEIPQIRVTPRQDLLFVGIDPDQQVSVSKRLREHGVALTGDVSALRRLAIACPALPTCGQALAEAERVMPEVVDTIESILFDLGLDDAPIHVNMTGCDNGCARPYTAEIGIVGRTKKTYDIFLGGSTGGDRLALSVREEAGLDELDSILRPVIERFAADRDRGLAENFGDWCASRDKDELVSWLPEPTVRRRGHKAAVSA
jgi:sulfite reductase (ferredoxin)